MKRLIWAVMIFLMLVPGGGLYAKERINGAGSTFAYPIFAAWAYQYQRLTKVRVNYQSIGSGGGIRQIANRTVDFGASDAPLEPEELKKKKLLQFPAIVGGVVPVINIPGIKAGQLSLDSEALCGIFLGKIKTWTAPKIKALNPSLKLPDKKITPIYRSDGSGTTAIFTTYLSQSCVEWRNKVGKGTAVKWPTGRGAKGNEGVANYVKRIRYSIGYVEFAYAKQSRLVWIKLKNPAGRFVEPSFETFQAAAATGAFSPEKHFYLWLTNSTGKNAWPISGATFVLLAREKKDANIKTVRFFDWAFKNGDKTARRLIYVPLPASLKEKIRRYWKKHSIY